MTEKTQQPRIRARMSNDFVDYLHNDLSGAAWYLRERINKAMEEGGRRDGIFLDMMAAAAMIAFTLEGYMNFLGGKVMQSWDEWQSPVVKVKTLRKTLGITADWNKRPYSTVKEIVSLRTMLAHPKPHRPAEREFIAEGTDSELRQMLRSHKPPYEEMITPEFINRAYEDTESIWREMLLAAKIEEHETWSGGSQGFEVIEHVEPESEAPRLP